MLSEEGKRAGHQAVTSVEQNDDGLSYMECGL